MPGLLQKSGFTIWWSPNQDATVEEERGVLWERLAELIDRSRSVVRSFVCRSVTGNYDGFVSHKYVLMYAYNRNESSTVVQLFFLRAGNLVSRIREIAIRIERCSDCRNSGKQFNRCGLRYHEKCSKMSEQCYALHLQHGELNEVSRGKYDRLRIVQVKAHNEVQGLCRISLALPGLRSATPRVLCTSFRSEEGPKGSGESAEEVHAHVPHLRGATYAKSLQGLKLCSLELPQEEVTSETIAEFKLKLDTS
ncbi:unnamed protein product [Echinostoma caproni]|uniref:PHD-type domain-containing protein n=1 Tax=Echinostoma caproni TaxID=27848 RepID=A0A183AKU9_9TREM|nr:unnamed protein product [Echinostoma caproni]